MASPREPPSAWTTGAWRAMLDGRCLLVVSGRRRHMVDEVLAVEKAIGDRLLGIVLNSVPRGMPWSLRSETLTPFITRRGVKVYAVLPEDRLLISAAVGELVERLGGKVVAGQGRMDELVENVMVGRHERGARPQLLPPQAKQGGDHGGDRADLQLAALETSTKCLILTGTSTRTHDPRQCGGAGGSGGAGEPGHAGRCGAGGQGLQRGPVPSGQEDQALLRNAGCQLQVRRIEAGPGYMSRRAGNGMTGRVVPANSASPSVLAAAPSH